MGKLDEAKERLLAAFEITNKLRRGHRRRLETLGALASVHVQSGEPTRARKYAEEFLHATIETTSETHFASANPLRMSAEVAFTERDPENAASRLRRALEIERTHLDVTAGATSERRRLLLMRSARRTLGSYLSVAAQLELDADSVYDRVLPFEEPKSAVFRGDRADARASAASVAASIPPGGVLLDFVVYEAIERRSKTASDEAKTERVFLDRAEHLAVLVLRPGKKCEWVRFGRLAPITEAIHAWRTALDGGPNAKDSSRKPYDGALAAIFEGFPEELARWLLGVRPKRVQLDRTRLAAAQERFTDQTIRVEADDGSVVLLHVEFQIKRDVMMPLRMAQYLSLLSERARRHEPAGACVECAVVYLDEREYSRDPGELALGRPGRTGMSVWYHVIKLWELDPEPFLALESPGLCPLVPLMRGNPESLVLRCRDKIASTPERLASPEMKDTLRVVLGVLAGRLLESEEIQSLLISEVQLMTRNRFVEGIIERAVNETRVAAFQEGREEGLEEGLEEGREEERLKTQRESLLAILGARFGEIDEPIRAWILAISDSGRLQTMLVDTATCESLESFLGVHRTGS